MNKTFVGSHVSYASHASMWAQMNLQQSSINEIKRGALNKNDYKNQ